MDLLIKSEDGICFTVTEDLEQFDLDKNIAVSQLLLDLKTTLKRIENRPHYEVVDMTPGIRLPGGGAAYNVALERKYYWMGKCDEASLHNRCPDDGADAVSKAQTWQDRVIRIMSGRDITKFTVNRNSLIPYITVLYRDGVMETWRD